MIKEWLSFSHIKSEKTIKKQVIPSFNERDFQNVPLRGVYAAVLSLRLPTLDHIISTHLYFGL